MISKLAVSIVSLSSALGLSLVFPWAPSFAGSHQTLPSLLHAWRWPYCSFLLHGQFNVLLCWLDGISVSAFGLAYAQVR